MNIGIIADGNRRWAEKNNLPAHEGHMKGFTAIADEVIPACFDDDECTAVTIYGFSTENWKRSPFEIKKLMEIYSVMCDKFQSLFIDKKVKLVWAGRRDRLPKILVKKLEHLEEQTKNNNFFTVYLCLDYGSHDELRRAVKKAGENNEPEKFENYLEVPTLDIIIRTGGEQRLSNFCMWQAAYSEFFFIPQFLPELTNSDVKKIIEQFSKRDRRKGGNKK